MARKRMIDPDFWNDEKLGNCSRDERLMFMGLISNADDEGRGRANSKLLKATIFPYDEDLKSKEIDTMLCNLAKIHVVALYKYDGQEFYYLPNFLKHQNINRPSESKLPDPTEESIVKQFSEDSVNIHGTLTPNRKEKNIKEKNIYAEYVSMSEDEYKKLVDKYGELNTRRFIEKLDNYKGQSEKNRKKYTSDYRAILSWVVDAVIGSKPKGKDDLDLTGAI